MIKIGGGILVLLVVFAVVRMWMEGQRSQTMNPKVGLSGQSFQPCPDRPNCVSSFSPEDDAKHYFAPRNLAENPLPAIRKKMIERGFIMQEEHDYYLYAQAKSSVIGFVDDIEFFYDPTGKLLHCRSASRAGYSDMGANRKRLEGLLEGISEEPKSQGSQS